MGVALSGHAGGGKGFGKASGKKAQPETGPAICVRVLEGRPTSCYSQPMKMNRSTFAFVAVPVFWAALTLVFGQHLASGRDFLLLVVLSAAAAGVWLAFVHLCVARLSKGRPTMATLYVATAVIGTAGSALAAVLLQTGNLAGALELGAGIGGLALASSLLFVLVAGLPWKQP